MELSSTLRSVSLVAVAALALAVPASASRAATDPIVGAWEYRYPSASPSLQAAFGIEIRVRAITPGVFVGTVARVGESTGCALPVGLEVWKLRLSRPGGYNGTVQDFYFGPSGNCDLAPRKAVWELDSTLAMCVVGETWFTGAEACVGYAKLVRAKKDVTPPRVRALPGTGRYGEKGVLRARLSDDSGWARANVRLYDGSTLIGWTDDKEFRRYSKKREYTLRVTWPLSSGGPLRFCVEAEDRAGNKATSCGLIILR